MKRNDALFGSVPLSLHREKSLFVEILKVFRNQSNNFKNNKRNEYADLLKVKYSNGKMEVICSTQLDN